MSFKSRSYRVNKHPLSLNLDKKSILKDKRIFGQEKKKKAVATVIIKAYVMHLIKKKRARISVDYIINKSHHFTASRSAL
jgi:hypothetical protein